MQRLVTPSGSGQRSSASRDIILPYMVLPIVSAVLFGMFELRGDGFRVEKVIYESRPNHHVTAALYLPEGKPPFTGVFVPCGHSANGKAAEAYQRASILLAKNGLAALCYDPIGPQDAEQNVTTA